jgi:hypothetical protein
MEKNRKLDFIDYRKLGHIQSNDEVKSESPIGINGPCSMNKISGLGKNIYIFGEYHLNQYCIETEKNIYFDVFLERLKNMCIDDNIFLDIYFEFGPFKEEKYNPPLESFIEDSTKMLSVLYNKYYDCVHNVTRDKCRGVRIHWSDARQVNDRLMVTGLFVHPDIPGEITRNMMFEICSHFYDSFNPNYKLVRDISYSTDLENMVQVLYQFVFSIPRIVQELKTIEEPFQNTLKEYFKSLIKSNFTDESFLQSYIDFYREFYNLIEGRNCVEINDLVQQYNTKMSEVNLYIQAYILDIYTICRMSKHFKTEKPFSKKRNDRSGIHTEDYVQPTTANNIIFYGGNAHAKVITNFFSSLPSFVIENMNQLEKNRNNCLLINPCTSFFGYELQDILQYPDKEIESDSESDFERKTKIKRERMVSAWDYSDDEGDDYWTSPRTPPRTPDYNPETPPRLSLLE